MLACSTLVPVKRRDSQRQNCNEQMNPSLTSELGTHRRDGSQTDCKVTRCNRGHVSTEINSALSFHSVQTDRMALLATVDSADRHGGIEETIGLIKRDFLEPCVFQRSIIQIKCFPWLIGSGWVTRIKLDFLVQVCRSRHDQH